MEEFLSRQIEVFLPLVDMNGCDALIRNGSEYIRVQIKTCTSFANNSNNYFQIRLKNKSNYDFDYLIAVCINNYEKYIYIIPYSKIDVETIGLPISYKGKFSIYKDRWDYLL